MLNFFVNKETIRKCSCVPICVLQDDAILAKTRGLTPGFARNEKKGRKAYSLRCTLYYIQKTGRIRDMNRKTENPAPSPHSHWYKDSKMVSHLQVYYANLGGDAILPEENPLL